MAKKKRRYRRPLTKAEIEQVVQLKADGKKNSEIAAALHVAGSSVTRLIKDHAPHLLGPSSKVKRMIHERSYANAVDYTDREPESRMEPQVSFNLGPGGPGGAGQPEPDGGRETERDNQYLKWVAKGAIRGWVDRLLKDIETGELA